MTFTFDRETALIPLDDDNYTIEASEVYRNPTGMAFGGWDAAITAKAVKMHGECNSRLISQSTTFLAGIGPGEVSVSVRLIRSGSSTQFWRVELSQNNQVAIASDVVTSNRRETELSYQLDMPETAAPQDCVNLGDVNPMAPGWIETFDQKIAKGRPFSINETPEALVWIKETDDRPIDRVGLFSICDTPMPRTFFVSDEPRFGSTVSMSTYIYASDDDLAEAGADYLLLRVDGSIVRNSKTDSRVDLWSSKGTLLATSNQIGFFR